MSVFIVWYIILLIRYYSNSKKLKHILYYQIAYYQIGLTILFLGKWRYLFITILQSSIWCRLPYSVFIFFSIFSIPLLSNLSCWRASKTRSSNAVDNIQSTSCLYPIAAIAFVFFRNDCMVFDCIQSFARCKINNFSLSRPLKN